MMDLDNSNNNNSPISNNIVVLLLAMGSAALVVSVYHIIAICCCHHQQLISAHQIQTQQQQQSAEQSTTSSVSHMIPSHKYHKIDDDGGTCAVCLGDFEEGEELKTLPECTHSFHVPCIDMWLHSHTSCPICRAAATPNSHGGGGGGPPFHGADGNHYAANQSIGMVQIAVVQNGLLPR